MRKETVILHENFKLSLGRLVEAAKDIAKAERAFLDLKPRKTQALRGDKLQDENTRLKRLPANHFVVVWFQVQQLLKEIMKWGGREEVYKVWLKEQARK